VYRTGRGQSALPPQRQVVQDHGRLPNRREAAHSLQTGLIGCACGLCFWAARPASDRAAPIDLDVKGSQDLKKFDLPRSPKKDAEFAKGMAYGMVDYERAIAKRKKQLFARLLQGLPTEGALVVDVGIGSFPNALYMGSSKAPKGMDIVGVDPNSSMEPYAKENALRAKVLAAERRNSFRVVRGVAEALPLPSGVADAVVCTLTLCSVTDPAKAVSEIRRVLKPGGQYLFVEHVLSETNPVTATAQRLATPEHVKSDDGCHFDRQTLETIRQGGFQSLDADSFELENCGFLNPTVAGIAIA